MSGYLKATSGAALVTVLLAAAVGGLARAKEAPPERLTIGYEDEGKVDASWQACLASAKEETEGWSKTDIENGARKICAARKRHVEAYAALQSNYRTLMGLLAQDVRLSPAEAAANLKIMMKACIDHKVRHHHRRPQHHGRCHRERDCRQVPRPRSELAARGDSRASPKPPVEVVSFNLAIPSKKRSYLSPTPSQ